jgi:hypothetical protein
MRVTAFREALYLPLPSERSWRDQEFPKCPTINGPMSCGLRFPPKPEALISDFCDGAYAEARRRAQEASSDSLARDWSEVALLVTSKTGKRSALLARMFH